MQIFVTHKNPLEAAQHLWKVSPIRARKMITETQQILACVQKHFKVFPYIKKSNGEQFKTPLSRMNHPIVKWSYLEMVNTIWLIDYLYWLFSKYEGSGFKNVLNNIDLLESQFTPEGFNFPWKENDIEFLNFAKCKSKNLDFTHEKDVFTAYKKYLDIQINNS